MKVLIDSNVFISAEDHGPDPSSSTLKASEFLRRAHELGWQIVVAAATSSDILRAPEHRKTLRQRQLQKYVVLKPIPLDPELSGRAGFPEPLGQQDAADLHVLNVLNSGAADWLVTDDGGLSRRARRAGFADRVLSVSDAIDVCQTFATIPTRLPTVDTVPGYQIPLKCPILQSIRADYPAQGD